MLDQLPEAILQQIIQYLRSWEYKQGDLLELSHVSQRLRQCSIRRVWEYFTITDIVISGKFESFTYIQPYLSRLLIADDEGISDKQWVKALEVLERRDWSHIKMFSVEFTGLHRKSDKVMKRILDFLHSKLVNVRELWVGLSEDKELMQRFFTKKFPSIEELRIIGKPIDYDEDGGGSMDERPVEAAKSSKAELLRLPEYGSLTVLYLDGPAAEITTVAELVRKSHLTLRDLNIGEFTIQLSSLLGMRSGGADKQQNTLEYPQLQRLAISNISGNSSAEDEAFKECGLIDGSMFPGLQSLYFSETIYPSYGGHNVVSESKDTRLMHSVWANVQCLAVDGLSQGDVSLLSVRMPRLEVLSIGALGSDAQLGDIEEPSVPLDLRATAEIISTCQTLVDLRIETPELYEDMYNNHGEHLLQQQQQQSPSLSLPSFDRPYDASIQDILTAPNDCLRHLTLNSWALTFDQLVRLLDGLKGLRSFEGILKFTSRFPLTTSIGNGHRHLSHLSLAHDTVTKYKHIFKSNLLRFISHFRALKALDVYGGLEIPGIENAIRHVLPGCSVGFYPLIPTWLLDAMEAGDNEDDDVYEDES